LHEEVGGGDGLLPEVNTCADRVPLWIEGAPARICAVGGRVRRRRTVGLVSEVPACPCSSLPAGGPHHPHKSSPEEEVGTAPTPLPASAGHPSNAAHRRASLILQQHTGKPLEDEQWRLVLHFGVANVDPAVAGDSLIRAIKGPLAYLVRGAKVWLQ
jgi:hypothetical protein